MTVRNSLRPAIGCFSLPSMTFVPTDMSSMPPSCRSFSNWLYGSVSTCVCSIHQL